MNLKINRDWRQWKNKNNDTHASKVVVGSEEGSGASQTPRPNTDNIINNFKIKSSCLAVWIHDSDKFNPVSLFVL